MTPYTKNILRCITSALTISFAGADTVPHVLVPGVAFSQNWSDAGLITTNDAWSGVPSITGYRGDDLTTATGTDPRTITGASAVVDVNANQTDPVVFNTGGVTEFALTNPTIALAGSGTADAPYISIFLNTQNVASVTISYNLRDLDGGADNAVQQIALQYRIGSAGNFTDVPAGYIADATSGPSLATLVTPVSVPLPSLVDGNSLVEVRIMTTNAVGNDEPVGIDDILVTGGSPGGGGDTTPPLASTFSPSDNATGVSLTTTPGITFNEPIQKGTGNILIKDSGGSIFETIAVASPQVVVSGSTVTITPNTAFAYSTGYYLEIPAGAIEDIAGNDYAGISGATAWNFTSLAAPDTTAPLATTFSPADDATGVSNSETPSITFDEPVKKGTGNILIKDSGGSTFDTIAVTSTQVVVSGSTVTITPGAAFANSTGYYLEIPAGAIEDIAGNDYAGISGATAWNFTTGVTQQAYVASKVTSATGAARPTGGFVSADHYAEGNGMGTFAVYSIANFRFNKVDFLLPGSANIDNIVTAKYTLTTNDRNFSAGSQLEFFLTTDQLNGNFTGKVFNTAVVNGINNANYTFAPVSLGTFPYTPATTSGQGRQPNTFTLNLSAVEPALLAQINAGAEFSIILAATSPTAAITYSGKNNTFDPGDPSLELTVNQTSGTDNAVPLADAFTPADGFSGFPLSSNLSILFNELVQKGSSGTISIFNSGGSLIEAIDVASSQVTVSNATVTIDPTNPLISGNTYYVQITAGAIEDVSGNDFSGISDTTTWDFITSQPPITAVGPFTVSENAPAGTVVGDLNPSIIGNEGVRYAILGGSGGSTMMKGVSGAGYLVNPIFTIGDTIEGSTGALNPSSAGDFSPVGTPDGLGAFALNANTIRVFMNHEIAIPVNSGLAGYAYTLANGTLINKGGARITYFDIDKTSRKVKDGGLAISRIYDRSGIEVTNTSQLDLGGFDRMCSASLFEPNLFGAGRGLADRIFFSGEESATGFSHPHGGTMWALDASNGDLWALPDLGRGSWENAALVDTGTTTHVALLLGDDTQACPLYLYVGQKNPAGNFIERNGLKGGQLYVWKATNGDLTPQQFKGHAAVRAGTWVAINAKNAAAAGTAGHDAAGYKNDVTLESEADSLGAFSFSRPEDLSTSPTDGTLVAFNSTGRGSIYPADNWGDTYLVDLDFTNLTAPTASIKILYDSDDSYNKGGNTYTQPENALRCQDNLDWADDGFLYVQEDQANQTGSFGLTGQETSIWKMDPVTGQITRIAQTDRSTVLPLGSTDGNVGDFGNWESSGILDVSTLFGETSGSLFIFGLQAHSITNGLIASKTLFEGGQLCFLEKGLETGAFAINPNSGAITIANPDAISLDDHPLHELRVQSYDGTNTSLAQVVINISNAPVPLTNNFKAATFNTSHYRDTDGTLITDLSTVTNADSKSIARIIQRNNADVILLNEFDYDSAGKAVKLFKENYLEVAQSGETPVYYPYAYIAPANTGVASGLDLDNNGTAVTTPGATGYGEDAFGFGLHPGQYAFVVLSKYPIDTPNVRTFQKFLWKDMPGALLPDNPNVAGAADWYSAAELNYFRLSSKNHADVPVLVNGTPVHILASHPTPPVFDDGAPWITGVDHNGRRNSDEIRFWSDYVNPAASAYIYDDAHVTVTGSGPAGNPLYTGNPNGGLPANSRFIICGDQNADNNEGDSTDPSIKTLIGGVIAGNTVAGNPLVNSTFTPAGGAGPNPDDTAAFSSGVRVDYCLPSVYGLSLNTVGGGAGVFWPASVPGTISDALNATDHHLVFVNLSVTGVELPPNLGLLDYYAPAAGKTGTLLQSTLQNIIDDHTVIDYNNVDEIMQVIDAADATNVRLIYSNANLPKTSFVGSAPDNMAWNREHVWPRSDGVDQDGPDFSDIHHLFPCQVNVNSLRSNFPFDEGSIAGTSDPFAPESGLDGNSWEPLDRDKGIVARAQLYMMTRYDGSDPLTTDLLLADNTSPAGTQGVLTTLLAWNRMFPPTDYERNRNNSIYGGVAVGPITYAQGNRNPFIDFPQFADAMLLDGNTNSFQKWQFENFSLSQLLSAATSGQDADADGDGRNNYTEFLMNGNPLSGTDAPLAVARNGNQITLTFHRPKGVVTEQASIQSCTSLQTADWQTVPNWQTSSTITSLGDYERIEYAVTIDTNTDPRRFWRVIYQ